MALGRCPTCAERNLVRILYGYPSGSMFEEYRAGAVELGGCIITGDDPSWRCSSCGTYVWRDGRSSNRRHWEEETADQTGSADRP